MGKNGKILAPVGPSWPQLLPASPAVVVDAKPVAGRLAARVLPLQPAPQDGHVPCELARQHPLVHQLVAPPVGHPAGRVPAAGDRPHRQQRRAAHTLDRSVQYRSLQMALENPMYSDMCTAIWSGSRPLCAVWTKLALVHVM